MTLAFNRLLAHALALFAAAPGESEIVNYKNADGQTEIGYLFRPAMPPAHSAVAPLHDTAARNLPATTRTAPLSREA